MSMFMAKLVTFIFRTIGSRKYYKQCNCYMELMRKIIGSDGGLM